MLDCGSRQTLQARPSFESLWVPLAVKYCHVLSLWLSAECV